MSLQEEQIATPYFSGPMAELADYAFDKFRQVIAPDEYTLRSQFVTVSMELRHTSSRDDPRAVLSIFGLNPDKLPGLGSVSGHDVESREDVDALAEATSELMREWASIKDDEELMEQFIKPTALSGATEIMKFVGHIQMIRNSRDN